MQKFVITIFGFFLILACFSADYVQASDGNVFLRPKKQKETLSKQRREISPILRKQNNRANTAQNGQVPSAITNPFGAPCTQKDLEAYAKIDKAINKAFLIDQDSLNNSSKRAKAQKEQMRAAKKFEEFMSNERNSMAYIALLGRCSAQINAMQQNNR